MSPTFHREMMEIMTALQVDPDTKIVILTGAGTAYSAGQDLKRILQRDGWMVIQGQKLKQVRIADGEVTSYGCMTSQPLQ